MTTKTEQHREVLRKFRDGFMQSMQWRAEIEAVNYLLAATEPVQDPNRSYGWAGKVCHCVMGYRAPSPAPLTDADVRRIVREEIERA